MGADINYTQCEVARMVIMDNNAANTTVEVMENGRCTFFLFAILDFLKRYYCKRLKTKAGKILPPGGWPCFVAHKSRG